MLSGLRARLRLAWRFAGTRALRRRSNWSSRAWVHPLSPGRSSFDSVASNGADSSASALSLDQNSASAPQTWRPLRRVAADLVLSCKDPRISPWVDIGGVPLGPFERDSALVVCRNEAVAGLPVRTHPSSVKRSSGVRLIAAGCLLMSGLIDRSSMQLFTSPHFSPAPLAKSRRLRDN